MTARPRIAFVHNLLIHYRVPLFNLFATSSRFKFDFFFGAVHPWMRELAYSQEQYRTTFRYCLLNGLRVLEYNYFSPSLLFQLVRRGYDAYVVGPLASPDCLVVFIVARLLRKPFILWEERWEKTRSSLSRLFEPIQLLIARNADLIIVPGSKSFEYFSTLIGRAGSSRRGSRT